MSVYFVATDPDQERQGIYKISKTANMANTLNVLNNARANKDFKIVKTWQCNDIKKADEFIKSALKSKYINGSTEWIKVPDDATFQKIIMKIETLIGIVNDDE
jgi:hypothetical protein